MVFFCVCRVRMLVECDVESEYDKHSSIYASKTIYISGEGQNLHRLSSFLNCNPKKKCTFDIWFDSHFAGTKEIFSGVDDEGNIYLAFECKEATDASHFAWGKSYEEIEDSDKYKIETEGDQ